MILSLPMNLRSLILLPFLAAAVTLLPACASKQPKPQKPAAVLPAHDGARLAELITQRLQVSQEVAWAKFVDQLPIKDPAREAELLERMVQQGTALGLPPEFVASFFKSQMAASRMEQMHLTRKWLRGSSLPTFPPQGLKRDLRPRLDAINTEMLRELARVRASRGLAAYVHKVVRNHGFTYAIATKAASAL